MPTLRIATYNIHKGVRGFGPTRRLEIHNLGHAVEQLDADVVCLQEVRKLHRGEALHFKHWPDMAQADFLAPHGYEAIYRTNAFTRDGEHGNALLSRWPVVAHQHEDVSDHRLEQRGLLHCEVHAHGVALHVVVVHLGLIRASRLRQIAQIGRFIEREVPPDAPLVVAGDFNDWNARVHSQLSAIDLKAFQPARYPTFPSRLPLVQLDYVYARGLVPTGILVPSGPIWHRMSDHLPLIAEFEMPQSASHAKSRTSKNPGPGHHVAVG